MTTLTQNLPRVYTRVGVGSTQEAIKEIQWMLGSGLRRERIVQTGIVDNFDLEEIAKTFPLYDLKVLDKGNLELTPKA